MLFCIRVLLVIYTGFIIAQVKVNILSVVMKKSHEQRKKK